MRKFSQIILVSLLFCIAFYFAHGLISVPKPQSSIDSPQIVIYTHSTLSGPEGLSRKIVPFFESHHHCLVKVVSFGSGGEMMNRLELEAQEGKPSANIAWGIDQQIWERLRPLWDLWGSWEPRGWSEVLPAVQVEKGFLPFDYGTLVILANFNQLKSLGLNPPKSLVDLLRPEWRRKILLQDPRTSTPGLLFNLYVKKVLKRDLREVFEKLSHQWLTLTPSWSGAYHLFLKEEAPLVWTYLSSLAYHEKRGDPQEQFQAILFSEGQPLQVEGAALLKGSFKSKVERNLSLLFLEYLLSLDVQKQVPLATWMIPVRKGVTLPKSFKQIPQIKKSMLIRMTPTEIEDFLATWRSAVEHLE